MPELPDYVDEELWFWSEQCGGRDYLFDAEWLTHPGRMAVYCPHDGGYRISKSELPPDLPVATLAFVTGFLAGNLPEPPSSDGDPSGATMAEWRLAAERFSAEGYWHVEADMEEPWRRTEAQCAADAAVLARIGRAIEDQVGAVTVEVPAELVAAALDAARRSNHVYGADRRQLVLERAACLTFLGMALAEAGADGTSDTSFPLEPRLLGGVLNAVDEDWDERPLDPPGR